MDKFYVGQQVTIERSFGLEEVIAYAKLTGDDNPLHIDAEFAQKSRFGKNIVHGMFVMGVVSKILGTMLPGNGTIYLGQDVKFKRPVYVDQKVFFVVTITDIEAEKRFIYLSTNVMDENGKCLVEGNARVLYEG